MTSREEDRSDRLECSVPTSPSEPDDDRDHSTPGAFRGYRFPAQVIAHAVWLYLRFPLSFWDVEEMLAQRGIRVSYETVRCWVSKFSPKFAIELRRREARPGRVWNLVEHHGDHATISG